jgi:tetratricopeptide (TPR) repeat protein
VTLVALDRSFEAIQDYNQALLIDPTYADARYNRATAYEETKQFAKSLEDVNQLVEEYPDSIQYLFFKGIVLTHLNELSEAASVFSTVWERDGSNIEALINVANVEFYQGHLDASLQLLEEAISIDPNQPNAYNTMNQILVESGDYLGSLLMIEKAIALDPSNAIFLNNRGFSYLMLDSLKLAIQDINASIVRDGTNMWAYRNKGIFFLKNGDLTQAERYLKEAVDAEDYVPESHSYLAEVYHQQGRREDAAMILEMEKPGHYH